MLQSVQHPSFIACLMITLRLALISRNFSIHRNERPIQMFESSLDGGARYPTKWVPHEPVKAQQINHNESYCCSDQLAVYIIECSVFVAVSCWPLDFCLGLRVDLDPLEPTAL